MKVNLHYFHTASYTPETRGADAKDTVAWDSRVPQGVLRMSTGPEGLKDQLSRM